MRIIHLVENLDDSYGGPAKSIPFLCHYLQAEGVEVVILSVQAHEQEHNTVVSKYDLNWESFPQKGPSKLYYAPKIEKRLLELINDDTIIHVHNSWTYVSFLARKMARKHKVSLVAAPRGSVYSWSLSQRKYLKKVFWNLFQRSAFQSARIIHVTEENEAKAIRDLKISTEMALVPNGIELPEVVPEKHTWKQNSLQELELPEENRYFLFLSRIHPKKGLDLLVNSWAEIQKDFPEWNLLIVGPEENQSYLQGIHKKLRKSNISKTVRFLGLLEGSRKMAAFGAAELLVLPSHTENFGIVIAEALALKIPVLTTHGTPWTEIEQYGAGWHIELSQENLTETLIEALTCTPEALIAKGEKSDEFISNYKWSIQAEKMKKVYQYILGGDSPENVLNC